MQKLFVWALAAGTLLAAAPAVAYEGPWCLRYNLGPSSPEVCHFRTFEACRDDRGFYGSTASCTQNPRYLPYWQGRGFGEESRQVSGKKKQRHH
jgi:hypothetical protein